MKLVIIEPLGIPEESLELQIAKALPKDLAVERYDTPPADEEELLHRGRDADIILVANMPLGKRVISGCEKLKLISVAFTGVDHIDMDACRTRGITVCNSAGYSTAAVADLAFGMLISLLRSLPACDVAARNGGTREGLVGHELEGRKFGVIGTGAIGLRVAAIARAFGCETYAYSRTRRDIQGVTYTDLDTLLKTCDVVSLHVPLTDRTRGMIGRRELALMKPEAILINTARGPLVDVQALADALEEGQLGGAAIDVFDTEPPLEEGCPLLRAPRTLLAPHVGFATQEALLKRADIALQNVAQWLDGVPQNIV